MSEQQNNNINVPPASVPFPGSLTPGWNDPPPITSSAASAASATKANSASGRQRLDLRKRIAYPIQSVGGGSNNAYGHGSAHIQPPVYTAPPAYNAPPVYVAPTQNTNAFSTVTTTTNEQQQQQQQYTTTGWPTQ